MEKDLLRLLQACVGIVVLLAVALLVFGLFPSMKSESSAAWVQAVGSIAAIWGTAWIARVQARETRSLEKWKENQQEIKKLMAIASTLALAKAVCMLLRDGVSQQGASAPDSQDCDHLMDVRMLIERITVGCCGADCTGCQVMRRRWLIVKLLK
jgi:hypothetical protein